MTLGNDFKEFCEDIVLDNRDTINTSINEIAKKLNSCYYELENEKESNMYVVGSVGRNTAIKGTSDVDLIFDLPQETYNKFNAYESNGQSALLQEVKNYLKERYPNTDLRGDGQVVVVEFVNYTVEVVPGFKQSDDSFKYPDSNDGGSWKKTDPLPEQDASKACNENTYGNFENLCHMLRMWKNESGFKFGGLLIDTLVYDFFDDNDSYGEVGYKDYLDLVKEVFSYLKEQDKDRSYWYALGSNQQVNNTDNGKFVNKAQVAYDLLTEYDEESAEINDKLIEIFGSKFPSSQEEYEQNSTARAFKSYVDTEEFIEKKMPVDIRYNLRINCIVSQDGWRDQRLSVMLSLKSLLKVNKKLDFYIESTDALEPYDIYWKVRNVGAVAIQKDCIRGQIKKTNQSHKKESSDFRGKHYVECYLVQNGICIARARIEVPISSTI